MARLVHAHRKATVTVCKELLFTNVVSRNTSNTTLDHDVNGLQTKKTTSGSNPISQKHELNSTVYTDSPKDRCFSKVLVNLCPL